MNTSVFSSYQEMSEFAANEILSVIISNSKATLCLATGSTPKLTYDLLVKKVQSERIDLSQINFVGLDEWVGVPPSNSGSCHFFLFENLFNPLCIDQKRIHLFDALTMDLDGECRKMNELIKRLGGIDLMLVGVGTNGHVGLNEPGDSERNHAHVSQLSVTTKEIGQKYFREKTDFQKGLTFGIADFFEAKKVIMMANGLKKAPIMNSTLNAELSMFIPSTQIRIHKNAVVILDKEAASEISTL